MGTGLNLALHPGFEGEGQTKPGYTAGSGVPVVRSSAAVPDSLLMGPERGFHEVKLVVQPGVFLLIVSEDGEPTFMRVLDDDTVRVPEKYGDLAMASGFIPVCTGDRRGVDELLG